ncbi:GrlR family regulatory protein [Cronobacter turicensis]|uniref:GrlR family regulatory protein n=1 Tax=Cronobacter turicensis TaxID=413502 RepID=UPI0024C3DF55|nr:GrlR family regulatory protein [Cronobacter turicensis]MDK1227303.1 negative regulator GrlR [Cronobacter turicensis]
MKNGIYYVVFSSNQNDVGNGTVVVKDGAVNGGDYGFTYQGKVHDDKLDLHVFQHDPQAQNVFQGINNYTMNLSVDEVVGGYQLTGTINGMPGAQLVVNAKHIGDLV